MIHLMLSVHGQFHIRTPSLTQVLKLLGICTATLKAVMLSDFHLWFQPNCAIFSPSPQNGEVDPAVKALEARQDEIMHKLYELKAAVEGLAKTVTTPDADLDLTVSSSFSSQSSSSTTLKGTADLDTLLGKVGITGVLWMQV